MCNKPLRQKVEINKDEFNQRYNEYRCLPNYSIGDNVFTNINKFKNID